MRVYPLAAAGTVIAMSVTLAACGGSSSASNTASGGNCKPAHSGVTTLHKGTLTVLSYVSPPYTIQTGSTVGGVDGTIVAKLAKMECLTLDAKPTAPAALIASLQDARGDVADGGIYYTAQRAQTLNLTTPMYRDGMALVSRKSMSGTLQGLAGKTLGVIQGYLWDSDFQKALGANVKIYQNSPAMISDILNGRLDAGVLTTSEAGYRAKQDHGLVVTPFQPTPKVAASQTQNNVVLAITKSETALTKAFDADIKSLLNGGFIADALKAQGMSPSLAGGTSS